MSFGTEYDTDTNRDSVSVRDYMQVLRRRWLVVVICTLLGLLVGAGYAKSSHKTYTSTASVEVRAVGQGLLTSSVGLANMATEQQVVKSEDVQSRAAALLKTPAEKSAAAAVKTSVPPASSVLTVTVKSSSPAAAQAAADALTKAYLASRQARIAATVTAAKDSISAQLKTLQAQSDKINSQIVATDPKSSLMSSLNNQQSDVSAQIVTLQESLFKLSSLDTTPGTISQSASVPTRASSKPIVIGVAAGVAGLALGIFLAFALESGDKRITTPRDLSSRLRAPVLSDTANHKTQLGSRRSTAVGAFEVLRTRLLLAGATTTVRSLAVLSPTDSVVKSTTSFNIAMFMAANGARVLLVLTDPTTSVIQQAAGLNSGNGQERVLATGADRRPVIAQSWQVPGVEVSVLDLNKDQLGSAYLSQPEALRHLLAQQRQTFDLVIIDGPPPVREADMLSCAAVSDATIVVAVARKTTREEIDRVRDMISDVNGRVLGGVLARKSTMSHAKGAATASIRNQRAAAPSSSPALAPASASARAEQ